MVIVYIAGITAFTNTKPFGKFLQLAVSVAYAVEAIVGVICQQQFNDSFAPEAPVASALLLSFRWQPDMRSLAQDFFALRPRPRTFCTPQLGTDFPYGIMSAR